MKPSGTCWVITDHAAGNQRQALALAEHLQMPLRQLILQPRAPWSWCAPHLAFAGRFALDRAHRALLVPPWPQVAIGCGRKAALFTRMMQKLSGAACYRVQILDPRIDPAHWDCVIAPQHDRVRGANVLTSLGSLNSIDDQWLENGRAAHPSMAELPRPRIGVLLGGPRAGVVLDTTYAQQLAQRLRTRQHDAGGSLLIVASRRTPGALMAIFRDMLAGVPGLIWTNPDDGRNPYPGVLGWADRLVVTPDSVNMLSEACAVGCPVETFITASLPARLARFHQALRDAGWLQDDDAPMTAERPPPLRETAAIAAAVRTQILTRAADAGERAR